MSCELWDWGGDEDGDGDNGGVRIGAGGRMVAIKCWLVDSRSMAWSIGSGSW